MKDEPDIRFGPIPEKYLDLRPQDSYEENIDILESVKDGEYDVIGEAYGEMHPRVFHRAFRDFYGQENGPAKVDEEALEDMQEILSENSDTDHFWLEDKLFNLGYTLGPKNRRRSFSQKRRERKNPGLPYGGDMIPDFDTPMPDNPVRKGRKKREGDEYYVRANHRMLLETFDFDIEVV